MKFDSKRAKEAKANASGRGPGKVNKLIKDVVFDTFHELQTDKEAIQKRADFKQWATDNPRDFYNIASKLINIQVTHEGNPLYPVIFKLDGKFTEDNSNNAGIPKEPGSPSI